MKRPLASALFSGLVAVAILACSASDDGTPSAPITLAQRCSQSCATPRSSDNPCTGQTAPATCQATCETTLAGKAEECVSCWLGYSGWRGTTCQCTSAFGLVDLSCSPCSYRANSKNCGTDLINKCTDGQRSCEGWVATPIDDPVCASKCGIAPNALLNRCQNLCLPPRDVDDPCHQPARPQIDACVAACTTRLEGKSTTCESCYFKYSAWLGQTCSCSGSSCEACNWYGNSGGSKKACAKSSCSNADQCRGFQDIGIDTAECAPLCGVPAAADAGTDASADADAKADAKADSGADAPVDAAVDDGG